MIPFKRHHFWAFAGRGLGTMELADMRVTSPPSFAISRTFAEEIEPSFGTSSASHAVISPFRLLRRSRTKKRSAARCELWTAPDHPPSLECDLLEPQLHSTNGQCAHPGPQVCEIALSDWRDQLDAPMCSLMLIRPSQVWKRCQLRNRT